MQWRDADLDTALGGGAARRRHLQLVSETELAKDYAKRKNSNQKV
jgi:hypothetical protein